MYSKFISSSFCSKLLLLIFVCIADGVYWNLGWPFALEFECLFAPIALAIISEYLFLCSSVWYKCRYCVYSCSILFSSALQFSIYAFLGRGPYHGFDCFIYDGEAHVVYGTIVIERLLFGSVILLVIAWKRKWGRH